MLRVITLAVAVLLLMSCKSYNIVISTNVKAKPCSIVCGQQYNNQCPTTYDPMCNDIR